MSSIGIGRNIPCAGCAGSGYYGFVRRFGKPEKDAELIKIIGAERERNYRIYGYRRMWLGLRSQNTYRNPKIVLRVMK